MNTAMYWLFAMVLLLVMEAMTFNLFTVWFAIGALAASVVAYFGAGILTQFLIFVFVSVILLALTRPLLSKLVKKKIATNADRVIGRPAVVLHHIDALEDMGQVKVLGQIWSARSEDGTLIKEGDAVEVLRIEGVKLIVRRMPGAKQPITY